MEAGLTRSALSGRASVNAPWRSFHYTRSLGSECWEIIQAAI
eukprot:COSAG05_NODE_24008_length_254_cov_0.877419_1_plen_41_part_01